MRDIADGLTLEEYEDWVGFYQIEAEEQQDAIDEARR